jgi:uncharacterized repeat protein (TIGR02543 family)
MLDPISADEYTVTYDPNGADGGAVPETRTSTAGDILVLAANHRGLTRTGFEFAGWNTVADGSGTSFPAGGSLAVDGDTTLFANWIELPTYIVSYDANGADAGSVPDSQWKTRGIALTLAANTGALTKGSYVFAGWNTAADGSGIDYPAGGELNLDEDVTLYARWIALPTFPVSYLKNGADGGSVPAAQVKVHEIPLTLAGNTGSLTRAGYTFVGWNTAADGSGTDYAAGASYAVDAAVTLYAQWYGTVSFDANGGGGPAMDPFVMQLNFFMALPLNTYSRLDHDFVGWNTEADGSGTHYADGAAYKMDSGDVTLYAQWVPDWAEQLETEGKVLIGPDGGITFLPDGYTIPGGGTNISVDPADGSIEATGRDDLIMEMPPVSRARLEMRDVVLTSGLGWGIFFHGDGHDDDPVSYEGFVIQFDPGLDEADPPIILRQWIGGVQQVPFYSVPESVSGVDLFDDLDVEVEIDSGLLTITVTQGGSTSTVMDELDVVALATDPAEARTSGYLGLRVWNNSTNVTIDSIVLYVLD